MEVITAQFSDSYFPIVDGVSVTISHYVSELNRTLGPACAVVPAVPGHADPEARQTFGFFSLPLVRRQPYRIGFPQLDLSLQRALRTRSFDLVHAHSPFCAGRFALKLARRRGIPIVATFHSKYREKFENLLPRSFLAQRALVDPAVQRIVEYYESVDQVWVPTEAAAETLRAYGCRSAVQIVRHGIDFDSTEDRAELRRRGEIFLSLDRRDFLFLYVGDHAWEKNLDFLLRSLRLLKRGGYRFKAAFVGEGYAARSLRSLSAGLGLAENAVFTGLIRDRRTLSTCYARADCFLFPSLYDTWGLVVREAAAFAVPSVVIDSSAAAEQIVDGTNGFVTDNSIRSYARKLAMLLERRDLLRRAGEGALTTLCTPWREVVQEVKERYLGLLGRSAVQEGALQYDVSSEKEMVR